MDASLKCDLTVARQRQPLAYRTHKPREIRVTECRRCTAPEEYGLERRTRNIWRIRRRLDLVDEDIDICIANLADLGRDGMAQTDLKVLKIMTSKGQHHHA